MNTNEQENFKQEIELAVEELEVVVAPGLPLI